MTLVNVRLRNEARLSTHNQGASVSTLLSAKDLQAKIALAEGEKASAAAKAHAAAEAEKQALLDRISKPSG